MAMDFIGGLRSSRAALSGQLVWLRDQEARRQAAGAVWRWLNHALMEETAAAVLWCPVFLAAGIALYFALPFEPDWRQTLAVAVAAMGLLALSISCRRAVAVTFLVALVCAGFALGSLRTALVDTPSLIWASHMVTLTGTVRHVEGEPGRRRMVVLDMETVETLDHDDVTGGRPLQRVRLAVGKAGAALKAGARIRVKARLFPLAGPAVPGGYDFGRSLWFQGIGATGFAMGEVKVLPYEPGLVRRLYVSVERLRDTIGTRIRAVLPGATGGLAVALVNGDRSGIPAQVTEAFQISGLAHMISISGMHMSMIAGCAYGLVRALLALLPLAVAWPVKKIAAMAALGAATGYFLISGQAVAAQRAYIMIVIMLMAVLLDRPAISMRNVALAAIVVLLISPETVLSASFQLSFLAVIALVAMFEAVNHYRAKRLQMPMAAPSGWTRRGLRLFGAMVMIDLITTVTAGLATAPVAAFHFQRVSGYSLLANLLGAPVLGLLVMPFLLVSLLLMPVGLEFPPLVVAGIGIDGLIRIANAVAALPGAASMIPVQPIGAILLILAGILWLCLSRTLLRFAGLAPILAGLALAPHGARPDLLVEREGRIIALRNEAGLLALSDGRRGRFAAKVWLARDGDEASHGDAARREGLACEKRNCTGLLRGEIALAYVNEPDALRLVCRHARVVIVPFRADNRDCPSAEVFIDRRVLLAEGAHRIDREADGRLTVATARRAAGRRPWVIENHRQAWAARALRHGRDTPRPGP
ncbi:ComEC/Rec2 family competence protein [Rhodoligotrophos defluvii]|uniref:ComEC/Rec2 family competence protein n=1 Tax=Rhodoligotrophos defluvii TaxID=2561934 RepID=UPI0010C9EDF3|nr:ComEC/Rec2 family competence protein [Rhodoligotrophos defluvii]